MKFVMVDTLRRWENGQFSGDFREKRVLGLSGEYETPLFSEKRGLVMGRCWWYPFEVK